MNGDNNRGERSRDSGQMILLAGFVIAIAIIGLSVSAGFIFQPSSGDQSSGLTTQTVGQTGAAEKIGNRIAEFVSQNASETVGRNETEICKAAINRTNAQQQIAERLADDEVLLDLGFNCNASTTTKTFLTGQRNASRLPGVNVSTPKTNELSCSDLHRRTGYIYEDGGVNKTADVSWPLSLTQPVSDSKKINILTDPNKVSPDPLVMANLGSVSPKKYVDNCFDIKVTSGRLPADVVFSIDTTGSMGIAYEGYNPSYETPSKEDKDYSCGFLCTSTANGYNDHPSVNDGTFSGATLVSDSGLISGGGSADGWQTPEVDEDPTDKASYCDLERSGTGVQLPTEGAPNRIGESNDGNDVSDDWCEQRDVDDFDDASSVDGSVGDVVIDNNKFWEITDTNPTVTPDPVDTSGYSSPNGDSSYGEYIESVKFAGDIDDTSGNNGGYLDSTGEIAEVQPGNSYNIEIEVSGAGYGMDTGIWIDFDQSDSLGGQLVGSTYAYCDPSCTITGSITVPNSASPGNTLMRVVTEGYGYADYDSVTFGEAEDYTVSVDAPVSGDAFEMEDENGNSKIATEGDIDVREYRWWFADRTFLTQVGVKSALDTLKDGTDRVGLVEYDTSGSGVEGLSSLDSGYTDTLKKKVDRLGASDGTNIVGGVDEAREVLTDYDGTTPELDNATKNIVIMTDGLTSPGYPDPQSWIENNDDEFEDVFIHAVILGDGAADNEDAVEDMGVLANDPDPDLSSSSVSQSDIDCCDDGSINPDRPNGTLIASSDPSDAEDIFDEIVSSIEEESQNETLGEDPKNSTNITTTTRSGSIQEIYDLSMNVTDFEGDGSYILSITDTDAAGNEEIIWEMQVINGPPSGFESDGVKNIVRFRSDVDSNLNQPTLRDGFNNSANLSKSGSYIKLDLPNEKIEMSGSTSTTTEDISSYDISLAWETVQDELETDTVAISANDTDPTSEANGTFNFDFVPEGGDFEEHVTGDNAIDFGGDCEPGAGSDEVPTCGIESSGPRGAVSTVQIKQAEYTVEVRGPQGVTERDILVTVEEPPE
jgi:hypothetical protein